MAIYSIILTSCAFMLQSTSKADVELIHQFYSSTMNAITLHGSIFIVLYTAITGGIAIYNSTSVPRKQAARLEGAESELRTLKDDIKSKSAELNQLSARMGELDAMIVKLKYQAARQEIGVYSRNIQEYIMSMFDEKAGSMAVIIDMYNCSRELLECSAALDRQELSPEELKSLLSEFMFGNDLATLCTRLRRFLDETNLDVPQPNRGYYRNFLKMTARRIHNTHPEIPRITGIEEILTRIEKLED